MLRGRSVLEQRRAETRGAESATAKGTGPDILTAPAGLPYSKGRDDRSSPPDLPYLPDPTPYSQLLPLSLQLSRPSPPEAPGAPQGVLLSLTFSNLLPQGPLGYPRGAKPPMAPQEPLEKV